VECGAEIIGINNRDLTTFKVDLQTTLQLAPQVPKNAILVSESGISTADDVRLLREAGVDAFLIGEYLMKSPNPGKTLRELMIRSLN
jgi:indole-3-glycerol phosphate synthase